MTKIDSKIPEGPVAEKWTNYKAHQKLVNPANKRRLDIIVVGTGLAGASAAASLGEMGFRVFNFCIQDSPRRAHSIAAQGGINAAKNYQNDNDSVYRLFYDTIKGGDYRAREANVYRLAEVSNLIIDQCVAQAAHPEADVIRLGIGDVTQPLAKCVVDAMHDAVTEMGTKEGFHGYGPEQGYPFLKQAIQGYYAGRGTQLAEDEIFISDGAKSDLANVLGLFDVDNTVLVPDPVYPTYVDDNVTDGRKIIYGRTSQENGFLGMPDDSVKADIIYICSPNNPTGAAYTRDQLKAWVEYARKNNAIILYDAAYECFISDGELARSIFEIDGARECAIEICSFSKIAGFTGTRCGYTIVPHELEREGMNLNKLWLRRQTTKFNGVPYVVQRAAAAVFTESGMAEIQANLDYYRQNAKVIADALDECGVWYCGGKNSPYIWLRCPGSMKSWEFFDWLLENCGVVGTPGVGFGECGEGYFRLTAFGDAEKTKVAAQRIKAAIQTL